MNEPVLNVLGQEVSEFVANRQYAKIQYLQQENDQLQEQVRDLDRALRLNKEILKLAFDSNNGVNVSNNSTQNSQESFQHKQVLLKLHEENEALRQEIKKMTEERNTAQNKVLLQQQIAEESQAFFKDLIQELEDKLIEMRRCIQDKEYTIQDIEKNRGLIENNSMVKIREIVTPNEQTLRMHEELESTRQLLNKLSQESQNLQELNLELNEANSNFKRELLKLRVILRSPVAYYKMKEYFYDDQAGNSDDNIQFQTEIYQTPGYGIDEIPQPQPPKQYGYQGQSQNIKYLTNNERGIYQEKLQKSETLLKGFKELFEKEKNKSTLLAAQLDECYQKLENSYHSNELLLQAIKHKEARIEQLQNELTYFRSQYGDYMSMLKNKRKLYHNLSFDRLKAPINQQQINYHHNPPQHPQKEITLKQNGNDVEVNVSILDDPQKEANSPQEKKMAPSDEDEPSPLKHSKKQKQKQGQYQMNFQECRQFLKSTAKELYLQYNIRMNNMQKRQLMDPKRWSKQLPIWHQKSSSDPLDYFTINLQSLFQISEGKSHAFDDRLRQKRHPRQVDKKTFNDISISIIQNKPKTQKKKIVRDDISFISDNDILIGI